MPSIPYMKFYVADYLADTIYLDVIESGAYLHLLMNYWQTGKPLPNDDQKLHRIAKCTPEQWQAAKSNVLQFFTVKGDQLHNKRIEMELAIVREGSLKASRAGKISAEKRKQNQDVFNERSTTVQQPHQRSFNHTDTDIDTNTDKVINIKLNSEVVGGVKGGNDQQDGTPAPDPKPKASSRTFDARTYLLKTWNVDGQLISDWLAIRAKKKLPATKTSIDHIGAQAKKAGITMGAAIQLCAENGWAGFKAEWYFNLPPDQKAQAQKPESSYTDDDLAVLRQKREEMRKKLEEI